MIPTGVYLPFERAGCGQDSRGRSGLTNSSTIVFRSQVRPPRLYGSRANIMPIAQVLVSAATVSPAPMANAIHSSPGTTALSSGRR